MDSRIADGTELASGLTQIRKMRALSHIPLLVLIVVATTQAMLRSFAPAIGEPIWQSVFFQAAWYSIWVAAILAFFLGFIVRAMKCPRCGNTFHYRRLGAFPWRLNEFTRSCLHCGLRLDGSNAQNAS